MTYWLFTSHCSLTSRQNVFRGNIIAKNISLYFISMTCRSSWYHINPVLHVIFLSDIVCGVCFPDIVISMEDGCIVHFNCIKHDVLSDIYHICHYLRHRIIHNFPTFYLIFLRLWYEGEKCKKKGNTWCWKRDGVITIRYTNGVKWMRYDQHYIYYHHDINTTTLIVW